MLDEEVGNRSGGETDILRGLHDQDRMYQKMLAAWQGDSGTWKVASCGLRDAMVRFAVERCRYYREVIDVGRPFEEIPILTKQIIRERSESILAEDVPVDRRRPLTTSGSTGQPMAFYRDTVAGFLRQGRIPIPQVASCCPELGHNDLAGVEHAR